LPATLPPPWRAEFSPTLPQPGGWPRTRCAATPRR
jgi:hypothetical protein